MPNFDLAALQSEYKTRNMRVLLSRLLKRHPDFRSGTIVTYKVRDTGDFRLQVCTERDEVRQVFLSPHCTEARTVRQPDPEEASAA
ncbi:MAG TPA: hypothetical protein VJP59_04520 [Gemmatimonadota bacterium]|nr:hypothetical protein [Gemmatimonadota bacterium]